MHCTWLGFSPCAPCGTEAERALWATQRGGASGIARSGQRAATVRVPRRKRARWETPGRELLPGHLRVSATLYLARFTIARRRWRKRARWETPGRELLPGRLQVSATLYLARFFPMRALWDRSLPPPVAETGRQSVGNRRERPGDATMRVPRRKRARGETPGRVGRCRIPKQEIPHRLLQSICIDAV